MSDVALVLEESSRATHEPLFIYQESSDAWVQRSAFLARSAAGLVERVAWWAPAVMARGCGGMRPAGGGAVRRHCSRSYCPLLRLISPLARSERICAQPRATG